MTENRNKQNDSDMIRAIFDRLYVKEKMKADEWWFEQLPPRKAEAQRLFWGRQTRNDWEAAERGFLMMEHAQDVRDARSNGDKAVALLETAAGYLERREPMPYPLADYLAKAFRATAKATESESAGLALSEIRANTLAQKLHITAPNRRTAADPQDTKNRIFRLLIENAQQGKKLSQSKAAEIIAKELGMNHRTAKNHWANWKKSDPKACEILLRAVAFHLGK